MDTWFINPTLGSGLVDCTFSFHWDCDIWPETLSGFRHFRDFIPDLADSMRIGVTAHPRNEQVRPWARRLGLPWAINADAVFSNSRCLAADNTSLLYEFAALDRPVVVLNPPWYRPDVEHGLRFWEYADVGWQVSHPATLRATIETALYDHDRQRDRRLEITAELFPVRDGTAAMRAAGALRNLL